MSAVSDDRWTCPYCNDTTTARGSDADISAALDAVRTLHAGGSCKPGTSARANARARRASTRAAARRRANGKT